MPSRADSPKFHHALLEIQARAEAVDQAGKWPTANLRALHDAGALAWSVPKKFGGLGMAPQTLHRYYERLAAACLTTALIVTQRDGAIEFLAAADDNPHAQKLLAAVALNQRMVSVGISQVTTSGRYGATAVVARSAKGGFLIDGTIPWATSAHGATELVAAADAGEGKKLVFILPCKAQGVRIGAAHQMAVLNASDTAAVELKGVFIEAANVLSGPSADALKIRARRRRFTLNTCVLPLGVARGALELAQTLIPNHSPVCRAAIKKLQAEHRDLAASVYRLGMGSGLIATDPLAAGLRASANHLSMRCALAALELAKGRGLQANHPAQRRVRESMFFFVWSSGNAVIEQTLAGLSAEPPLC